jgi:hypothetical protein
MCSDHGSQGYCPASQSSSPLRCGCWPGHNIFALFCPPSGACPPNGWGGWTDYTPFSLVVAGMLNIPVAIFGAPLYHLLQERTANSELIALLVGVVILWSYIGWILDTRPIFRFKQSSLSDREIFLPPFTNPTHRTSHGRIQLTVACRKRDKRRQSGRPRQ